MDVIARCPFCREAKDVLINNKNPDFTIYVCLTCGEVWKQNKISLLSCCGENDMV